MAAVKRSLLEGDAADSGDSSSNDAPNKRRRIISGELKQITPFSNLPNDCKVNILTFLPAKDKNAVAECNRDCNEARNNKSLDQKRTGTIVWTESTTTVSFCNKIREVQGKFTGNRTQFALVGLERSASEPPLSFRGTNVRLPQVTSLDCRLSDVSDEISPKNRSVFRALGVLFPNLQSLDLSSVTRSSEKIIPFFVEGCPFLKKITWSRSVDLLCCGFDLKQFTNLTELYLDNSRLCSIVQDEERDLLVEHWDHPNFYMLMHCSSLERLSLKDVTINLTRQYVPVPQDFLVEMVRRHPTLRWLRSDLTVENVAMLKQERPEMTFVSD